jgi:hypothetical protein
VPEQMVMAEKRLEKLCEITNTLSLKSVGLLFVRALVSIPPSFEF